MHYLQVEESLSACHWLHSSCTLLFVRTWRALYILTWKRASRHSGVQVFDIGTSKKCSETLNFLAFWLQNELLATAACNFCFLLWRHDSAPAALTSLLFDSPDTRIIGKTQHFATSPTFGAGESSFFRLSRYCIFVLWTLLHLICFSSAFQLSILSEVYYLNFLRSYIPFFKGLLWERVTTTQTLVNSPGFLLLNC